MDTLKGEVISKIPSILENHFEEIRNSGPEISLLFHNNYDYIRTSLEMFFTELAKSIFDHDQFIAQKKQADLTSYEIGKEFLSQVKLNINAEKLFELNQHLYQKVFISLYEAIELKDIKRSERITLIDRLHELIWISSQGFFQGYLFSKNQEIDRLHQQKVSIMGQMAAGMAHEIRNPVTSIKGFIHLMKEQNEQWRQNPETWAHYLSICETEIESIEKLVSDFLLLSKKNHRQKNDHDKVHNLNVIFQRIEPFCHFYALQKRTIIQFHAPDKEILTYANPQHMEQIFLNIVRNAIDAVSDQGMVSLSCSYHQDSNEWVILCDDNGCGIPPETLEVIFEPFFTTKLNGTGLGLPICKSLIEEMDGSLRITSVVDKGTTVEIRVPAFLTKN